MPGLLEEEDPSRHASTTIHELPFPPVTKSHILNCSYHSWYTRYRAITPKARLISLPPPFLAYLRADGIILPEDDVVPQDHNLSDHDSFVFSVSEATDDEDEQEDIASEWTDTHNAVKAVIEELGGKVVPKLNWSAPKDATWMNANSMECRAPNDVYLLLKSSDFITHDLEHAFDECVDTPGSPLSQADIPYHLILRKAAQFNPSVEFRCFVRSRKILGICQRDLNHYEFLAKMEGQLRSVIQEFFDVRLRDTFPDENFVFDVYIPAPHKKVWLVDINPWAPRTDPLLFSWLEILTMPEPTSTDDEPLGGIVRLSLHGSVEDGISDDSGDEADSAADDGGSDDDDCESDADEELWLPELRLIKQTDPEAYSFSTQQYSAHKLPKDVVDASQSGEGLREFARDWQNILAKRQQEDAGASSDDETTT